MRLPQIGSERNTSEERINQNEDPNKKYDNDDERSVGFFNKVTSMCARSLRTQFDHLKSRKF